MKKGQNVTIMPGCHIAESVVIEDNVYIDYNCIIRENVTIQEGTTIGANCVLGEYTATWYADHNYKSLETVIGKHSVVRSGSIIYSGVMIGDFFQSGHQITVREESCLGHHCSIGTLCDIQGHCNMGDYVRCHSNVHISQASNIGNYVWIYPYSVLTNDPIPPSEVEQGVTIRDFAVIATGSILLPGVEVESDTLVAAGAVVTKNVKMGTVVGGNPAKPISTIDKLRDHLTKEPLYPWRETFTRGMPWAGIGYQKWVELQKQDAGGV